MNTKEEKTISFLQILKLSLLVDPHYQVLMKGHYEDVQNAKTLEEFCFVGIRMINQMLESKEITRQEKVMVFKFILADERCLEGELLEEHLDMKSKEMFNNMKESITQTRKTIISEFEIVEDLVQLATRNDPKEVEKINSHPVVSFFRRLIFTTNQKKPNIQEIIDPFYLGDHQELIELRSNVREVLKRATSDQFQEILNVIVSKNIVKIEDMEYEIDVDKLTKSECLKILSICN